MHTYWMITILDNYSPLIFDNKWRGNSMSLTQITIFKAAALKWQNINSSTLFCKYSTSGWVTDNKTWGSSAPIRQQKEKPFTSKQRSRWLYESVHAVRLVSLPRQWPCTSTIAIQVPNCTYAACCWSAYMTNYFWAYYRKSALARGSGWREGGKEDGS